MEILAEGWYISQDNWMYLDENWYYFDADGYMAADRTAMKEGRLCWLDSSGLLSEGRRSQTSHKAIGHRNMGI